MTSRRQFILSSIGALGGISILNSGCMQTTNKEADTSSYADSLQSLQGSITIAHTSSQFEREPLISPFGFKGGYLSELSGWEHKVFCGRMKKFSPPILKQEGIPICMP